jgi:galactose-1-phosphate uridylyltransferase
MCPDVARRGLFGRPCLPCEYVHFEVSVNESQSRTVVENEHFVTLSLGGLLGRSKFYVSKITPSYRDREAIVCEHPLLGHQAIRQSILVFARVLLGRVVVRNEHFVALVPWWAVGLSNFLVNKNDSRA